MNRVYQDYARDILSETERILEFVKGKSFEDFKRDYKTSYVVFKALENIGEATKRIPFYIRENYPSIPFREMTGIRNILSHEYFSIDYIFVWNLVKKRLPALLNDLRLMVREIEEREARF